MVTVVMIISRMVMLVINMMVVMVIFITILHRKCVSSGVNNNIFYFLS